jgi:hypothetical protein
MILFNMNKNNPLFLNIHNLVLIVIYGEESKTKENIKKIFHHFVVGSISQKPNISFFITENPPRPENNFEIGSERYFFKKEDNVSLLYLKDENSSLKTIKKDNLISYEIYTKNIDWLYILIQNILIKKGYTFIHAAALSYKNKGILLPAWGGTGKTIIIGELIKNKDVKFLGDDFVIISKNGEILSFPRPFVLYHYHDEIFEGVFSKKLKLKLMILSNIKSFAKKLAKPFPKSIRMIGYKLFPRGAVNPNPEDVLSKEKMIEKCKAVKTIFISRASNNNFIINKIENENLSKMATGITHYEFSVSNIAQLIIIPSIFEQINLTEYFQAPKEILSEFLNKTDNKKVLIPKNMRPLDLVKNISPNIIGSN